MNNRYHIWRKHMILDAGNEKEMEEALKRDYRSDKYNPEERMKEIVENCPFFGREYETKSILIALAAGQNVVLYGNYASGKTAFAEWAKKAFGAGECIETYSYKKFATTDEIDTTKTNIVILEDYLLYPREGIYDKRVIHPEIADACPLRIGFERISDDDFKRMLLRGNKNNEEINICFDEILFWKQNVAKIKITDDIYESILKMRNLAWRHKDGEWYNAVQLVKASAYFDGCEEVSSDHLSIFVDSVCHDLIIDSFRGNRERSFRELLQKAKVN